MNKPNKRTRFPRRHLARCVVSIRYDTGQIVRLSCTDVVDVQVNAPRDDDFGETIEVFEPSPDPNVNDMIVNQTHTDTLPGWLLSVMGSPEISVEDDADAL